MKTRLLICALALMALLTLSACESKENHSGVPAETAEPTPATATPTATEEPTETPATTTPVEVAAEVEWSSPLIKFMMECAYMGNNGVISPPYDTSMTDESYAEFLDLFYKTVDEKDLRITESFLNNIRAITMYQPFSDDSCTVKFEYYNEHQGSTEYFIAFPLWFTVETLEDFRNMPNLEELTLRYTTFTDLTPLESLSKLKTFCIGSVWYGERGKSVFTDLTPLTRCPELRSLKLDCTNIEDLGALSQLSNLTWLQLYNINGQDMAFLSGMSSLEELVLERGENVDLDALVKYAPPSMTSLRIGSCGIKDITAISKLTQLEELYLGGNLISDISPLRNLTNLKKLCLTYNQISDISPLAGLFNLVELELNRNQIEDISALAGMKNLVVLNLDDNNITDLSLLYRLEKLETLYLYDPEHDKFVLEWLRWKGKTLN